MEAYVVMVSTQKKFASGVVGVLDVYLPEFSGNNCFSSTAVVFFGMGYKRL